jgi:hypothetical protein
MLTEDGKGEHTQQMAAALTVPRSQNPIVHVRRTILGIKDPPLN